MVNHNTTMGNMEIFERAKESLSEGKLDAAEKYCAEILEESPKNRDALHLLALVRYRAGDANQALELLRRAIRVSPNYALAYKDYAGILIQMSQPQEALKALQTAIQLEPGFVEARIDHGNVLHQLGRIAEAEKDYRSALRVNPRHVRGCVSLGNLLRTTDRVDESITYFQIATQDAPNDPLVQNFMGVAYRDSGEGDKALDQYRLALKLDPFCAEANANYGSALIAQGHHREAIAYLDRGESEESLAKSLECLLHIEEYDQFFSRTAHFARNKRLSLKVAAMSAYASQQLHKKDAFPFCPEPLEYVRIVDNPGESADNREFLAELIKDTTQREAIWEPHGVSTHKGFQSAPTLFESPTQAIASLRNIILAEVDNYRNMFPESRARYITDWPEETIVNGWFVRLLSGGHQEFHNHDRGHGWVSGCYYLQMPTAAGSNEGAIEFGLKKPSYPKISEDPPTVMHVPGPGQMVLFPSSLFHRTVPFHSDGERLCIAFDVARA